MTPPAAICGWKSSVAAYERTAARSGSWRRRSLAALALISFLSPIGVASQQASGDGARREIFAGSELENYIRYLQSTDGAPEYPWSVRPFSPRAIDHLLSRDAQSPWRWRYDLGPHRPGAVKLEVIPPSVSVRFNSNFPYGSNDGPIWAGRGITSAAQAGFYLGIGPISLTVAPMVFRSENRGFTLENPGAQCPPSCADPLFHNLVDRPQRFGDRPYQRFDPGQSTLSFDALGVSAGITTADEWWGPTQEYPYLLGDNAPGFPHVYFATGHPTGVLIGKLQARVIYGRLDQSAYSPVSGSKYYVSPNEPGRVRFASGIITTLQPRGLPGLELGIGRFFHSAWPATGIPRGYLLDPFRGFLGSTSSIAPATNQLASGFARWVFPHSGLEIYGEYGRDDYNYDFRDLVQEPDHDRTYSVGLRKVLRRTADSFNAFRFELMNYQLPTLARLGRGEGAIYLHSILVQGHTNRGQLLGSSLGVGAAAGSTFGWDRYTRNGRVSIVWERAVPQDSGTFYLGGNVNPRSTDVSHTLRFERVVFLRAMDLTSGAGITREFNRDFRRDEWNLNALVQARYRIP